MRNINDKNERRGGNVPTKEHRSRACASGHDPQRAGRQFKCDRADIAYAGKYRSRMQPKAFVASLTAWLARYNCQIIFYEPATTGKLIREVLYRELKERLEVMECPQAITDS